MTRDLGVTFAGGGSRAFYQLGFMETWSEVLLPRTAAMAACSAGAAMSTLLLTERVEEAREIFADKRKGLRGHIDATLLRQGKYPFPHDAIYRATLRHALADGGFERIQALPFPLYIVCSGFPPRMPSVFGIALGLGAYQLEKRLRPRMLHPRYTRKLGFITHSWDARQCETAEDLVELVLSSSSTPPFTKRGRYGNQLLVDGSLIDNAPAFLAEEVSAVKQNIILLTRPYPKAPLGIQGSRIYLAPETPLPIERWDYREVAPVEETVEVGRADAIRHRPMLERFLAN